MVQAELYKRAKMKMSYWVIPGKQDIKVFANYDNHTLPLPECIISIFFLSGVISFYKGAGTIMDLKQGERVKFITIDEMVFVCKADDGTQLWLADNRFLRTKATRFVTYLRKHFNLHVNIKCKVEQTGNYFNGKQLFKVVMPRHYKYNYFKTKNK
jgi:hypothetical protein